MDLDPYVAALRDDLATAAAVGDDAATRAGTALAAALEPAVRLALMNALSDLASEISDQLDDRSVDLRLQGRQVRVVVDRTGDAAPFGPGNGPDVGDISRMTLRIVDQIKGQAERAAAAQGMSLNSWVAQAVQGALRGQHGEYGQRGGFGGGWGRGPDPDEPR